MWVDHLESLARLCPAVSSAAAVQQVDEIEICRWEADFPEVEAADVVIEAFACQLPESYLAAMARRSVAPVWINLEYLSAEDWVEGCHRMPSLRTKWPLDKHFFFPGFTPQTGGLLRERDLLAKRAAFDSAAEAELWQSLGVPARSDHELRVSLFCYENASLPDLLHCWADGQVAVTALATPGPAADQVAHWIGEPLLPGTPLRRRSLTFYALPFLPQAGFDRLLWACDVNFVRGEDSFVRARGPGGHSCGRSIPRQKRHIRQAGGILGTIPPGLREAAAVRRCWHAWNGRGHIAAAWPDFVAHRQAVEQHGRAWASRLDQTGDLAENLSDSAIISVNPDYSWQGRPVGVTIHTGKATRLAHPAARTGRARKDGNLKMGVVTAGELQSGQCRYCRENSTGGDQAATTKSGRNAAVVKLRVKNLMTDRVSESVMKAEEKMETVVLEKKGCTYSYYAAPNHVFVDEEFNQYEIDAETIPDLEKYLIPEMSEICEVTFYEGRPISVVLPKIIVREVEYTEPAARGDTSGKIQKPAVLKGTKHELQVSAFIEIGDKIEIDTETGEFRRRCT